jgi:hypothetical protein
MSARITKLELGKEEESFYLSRGIEVLKGLRLDAAGAVDMRVPKSEATYDVGYSKDNVEVSLKLPLLADYAAGRIYVGKSFLNTLFPMAKGDEGKLIRFDLNDSVLGSPDEVRLYNRALNSGIVRGFSDLNDSFYRCEEEGMLTRGKRIGVKLGHEESVELVLRIVGEMGRNLYEAGAIGREEYDGYRKMSEEAGTAPLFEKMKIGTEFGFEIDGSGYLRQITWDLELSEPGEAAVGLALVLRFEEFGEPRFSLDPARSGSVEYQELFGEWESLIAPLREELLDEEFLPVDPDDAVGSE